MISQAPDVLNVTEVAELLRVGRNHVYALVARNGIPHRRVGKHLRFRRSAILAWLEHAS
jgi:excisionase family DNA binding protein